MNPNFVLNFSELFERIQRYAQRTDLAQPILSISLTNGQVHEGILSQFSTNSKGQFVILRTKNNGVSWILFSSIIAVSIDNPDVFSHLFSEKIMTLQTDSVSSLTFQRRLNTLSDSLSDVFEHKITFQIDLKNLTEEGMALLYNYSMVLEEVFMEIAKDSLAKSSVVEEMEVVFLQIGLTTQYQLTAKTLNISLALPISPKDIDALEIKGRIEGVL